MFIMQVFHTEEACECCVAYVHRRNVLFRFGLKCIRSQNNQKTLAHVAT